MGVLLIASVTGLLGAVQPQVPVFPVGTDLVYVVVNATRKSGEAVQDLSAADFVITEDGERRTVAAFSRAADTTETRTTESDVEIILLMDTSSSMRETIERSRDLAVEFLKGIPKVARRGLLTFDGDVRAWFYDEAQPLASVTAAISRTVGAGSRLYDGIIGAANLMEPQRQRRIIVALTDGLDEGSKANRETAIKALQDRGITFYAVSFAASLGVEAPVRQSLYARMPVPTQSYAERAALNLHALATATGGFVAQGTATDLRAEFHQIRQDISTQYVIGFEPGTKTRKGRRHELRIESRRDGVRLRYRREYGETPPTQSAQAFSPL